MTNTKIKALDKLLLEMTTKHTGVEDIVHNWLCDQNDPVLFEAVLKEDKSIRGSVTYCMSQAQKYKQGNMAMVDSPTVFKWIRTYFLSDKNKTLLVKGHVVANKKIVTKPIEPPTDIQLNLFEELRL